MNRKEFYKRVDELSWVLQKKQLQVKAFLSLYETKATAEDEIARSITTLAGARNELKNCKTIEEQTIAVFFPLNLPLYSLILFAVMPSFFAKKIFVRCPEVMRNVLGLLVEILNLPKLFPDIDFVSCNRTRFLYKYVKKSDVVIFMGKYENAMKVLENCKNRLFIFNGSGINPVVIFNDADIDLSVDKSYKMRLYNSGQDCAGPDVFFVQNGIKELFLEKLLDKVGSTVCGNYSNEQRIDVGPIQKEGYVKEVEDFLKREENNIVLKGEILDDVVSPYILGKNIKEHRGSFKEFFAPIFYLLYFEDEAEVLDMLNKNRDKTMYVSYFSEGKVEMLTSIDFATKIKNKIIDDVEQGNLPYGGYGAMTNFVFYDGEFYKRPILISREIENYIMSKRKEM